MQVNQIRSTFLNFFKERQHTILHSSPLVPHNDPTLMFANAGMNQFKNYFTGAEKPPYPRAATAQKVVRAGGKHNDLENVGYTARHLTFFEMLGNFSFGDYFKEHAIEHAWNLLTKDFALSKDRLYVTVYHTDDEAINIWKKVSGFNDDKIIRIRTDDNFWTMGDIGPCGPCSEIFFDHGASVPGGLPGTPEEDGDRYVEIWNLVFMQFEDKAGGERIALPKPSIDTGMGLERLAAVLQGKHNNFEIDLFQNLIDASRQITSCEGQIASHRVIADHLRSSAFLIADGVMPSNEGRGYVLRRIMRRAMRHVHVLGYKDCLLYKLVPTLVTEMGEAYPELKRAEMAIVSTLKLEEEKFRDTLDKGLKILNETTSSFASGDVLDGVTAFKLYDTYGFPIDLTGDILRARSINVDLNGFDEEMRKQKERARAAWAGSGEKATDEIWFKLHDELGATEFLGYTTSQAQAKVQAILVNGQPVDKAANGQALVILNQTPLYAESGGQIGDTGYILGHRVTDVKKFAGTVFVHYVELGGELKVGDVVEVKVDDERRAKIKSNHSATHLLDRVLIDVLGKHVTQKGSLVAPDRLRFDFSHPKALTSEEITEIEDRVNKMIIENTSVQTEIMSTDNAIKKGAIALFGEKYGEEVRVVSMGSSIELCGGTHVRATGDIGLFKIISEESIASGVRRIEAITGIAALEYIRSKEDILRNIANTMKCKDGDIPIRIATLTEEKKRLENEKLQMLLKYVLAMEPDVQLNGTLRHWRFDSLSQQDLRSVADNLKNKIDKGVGVVSATCNAKLAMIIFVRNDNKLNAGEMAKSIAPIIGGNGGGRADMAQVGGDNLKALDEALKEIQEYISLAK